MAPEEIQKRFGIAAATIAILSDETDEQTKLDALRTLENDLEKE